MKNMKNALEKLIKEFNEASIKRAYEDSHTESGRDWIAFHGGQMDGLQTAIEEIAAIMGVTLLFEEVPLDDTPNGYSYFVYCKKASA